MIRAKGGRRQSRYYYLKNKGAEKLCSLLENMNKVSEVDRRIENMKKTRKEMNEALNKIKEKMNALCS